MISGSSVVTFGPDPDSTLQTKPIIGTLTIPTQGRRLTHTGGMGVIEVALHEDNNPIVLPQLAMNFLILRQLQRR